MRFRYRRLSSSFDADAYKYVVKAAFHDGEKKAQAARDAGVSSRYAGSGLDEGAVAAAAGIVSAPRKVAVDEGSAEERELRELIQTKSLKPTDLVSDDDGATWTTIAQHPAFYELFEEGAGTPGESKLPILVVGALVLGGIGACIAFAS